MTNSLDFRHYLDAIQALNEAPDSIDPIDQIAQEVGISGDLLRKSLRLDGLRPNMADTASVLLVKREAKLIAQRIASGNPKSPQAAAIRLAMKTPAARANPEQECGKCAGKGRIDAFGHRSSGMCYQCNGTGVITSARKKR